MKKILLTLFIIPGFLCGQIIQTEIKLPVKPRTSPEADYSVINHLPEKDTKVLVLDFKNDFWLIRYDTIQGWVPTQALYRTSAMTEKSTQWKEQKILDKYGPDIGKKIIHAGVWVGMTRAMLIDSKGHPDKINKTKGSGYNHEQWIYPREFIYLEDDVVSTIQSYY